MDKKNLLIKFWKDNFEFRDAELNAFMDIKREDFVFDNFKNTAYEDTPLPLIRGKTISQPTTVMIMTHYLELKPAEKVFELGTGSGYQAAIIAKIIGAKGKVITTEVIPELVQFSRENLKKADINNVFVYEEDGSNGMPSEAPFDKVIVTSACKEFPKPLLEQLKCNGIIVGPIGNQYEQEMVVGKKMKDGNLELNFLGHFLFTPMYGKYGFEI